MATWNVPLEINNLTARVNAIGTGGLTNPLTTTLLAGGNSITGVAQLAANAELIALGAGNRFTVTDQSLPPNAFIDVDNVGNLTLSGTVRAPTVTPATDSSTKVATTAFVQSVASGGGTQTQTASPVTITSTSPEYQVLTGSLAYTVVMPDATTITPGRTWVFNVNTNATAYTCSINGFTGTNLVSNAQSGAAIELILLTNATSAGTWDVHSFLPTGANFGNTGLVYQGNLLLTGSAAKTIGTSGTGSLLVSAASNQLSLVSGSGPLAVSTSGLIGGLTVTNGAAGFSVNTGYGPASNTLVVGSSTAQPTGANGLFVGLGAGTTTSTGGSNTLLGAFAGPAITNGFANVVVGASSATLMTAGSQNTIIGSGTAVALTGTGPGTTGASNVVVGANAAAALTTGNSNTIVGLGAGGVLTTGDNNIYVGPSTNASAAGVSNEIVIGSSITGKGANTVLFGGSSATNQLAFKLTTGTNPGLAYVGGGAISVATVDLTITSVNQLQTGIQITGVPIGAYLVIPQIQIAVPYPAGTGTATIVATVRVNGAVGDNIYSTTVAMNGYTAYSFPFPPKIVLVTAAASTLDWVVNTPTYSGSQPILNGNAQNQLTVIRLC